ncbi:MAG TPA: TetR family transcriptional regulator [Polyangiaceae bacterium]|nr:TetR family transcriptional regulator [Polyangiaceae bacterium]
MRINPEKKEERERVAHSLLRATLTLAAAHGFGSLGLREVSRTAGIAPTSFYRHFADMEELGLALIETLFGPLVLALSSVEGASPQDPVESLVNRTLAAAVEDAELFRFVVAERVGSVSSFRAALGGKLALLSTALLVAHHAGDAAAAREGSDAAVTLLLDACGELLDRGPESFPRLSARVVRQARLLLGRPGTESAS